MSEDRFRVHGAHEHVGREDGHSHNGLGRYAAIFTAPMSIRGAVASDRRAFTLSEAMLHKNGPDCARISLGAHFPADVLAGYFTRLCVVLAVRLGVGPLQRIGWGRRAAALALPALLIQPQGPAPCAAAEPVHTLAQAALASALTPGSAPGANDWGCVPSPAHPYPVVLVHGTLEGIGFNWARLAPALKDAGYCVFALSYGTNALSLGGRIGGLGDIARSAKELQAFVERVLAATQAKQVDIVGHSQGGMLPNYYLKRLGGAPRVRTLVGLAPSNHGTSLSGLKTLVEQTGLLKGIDAAWVYTAPSLIQQQVGSAFMTALFADGDTVPGPRYVVVQTSRDKVVTPYTQAFLTGPRVRNILIQEQCPDDPVGHIALPFDGPAVQNVLNALGPDDPHFKAECVGYGEAL